MLAGEKRINDLVTRMARISPDLQPCLDEELEDPPLIGFQVLQEMSQVLRERAERGDWDAIRQAVDMVAQDWTADSDIMFGIRPLIIDGFLAFFADEDEIGRRARQLTPTDMAKAAEHA